MLQNFVVDNRQEIAQRCATKVSLRLGHGMATELPHTAVPLFLDHVAEKLLSTGDGERFGNQQPHGDYSKLRGAASAHGTEMLKSHCTVKQVVQGYGDICQSVTELAHEKDESVAAWEFGILNLCLDYAIADAVASFGSARDQIVADRTEDLHARLNEFVLEHERVTTVAAEAFAAMRSGAVGATGATARLLEHSLEELGWLVKRVLPELRLASAKTTVA